MSKEEAVARAIRDSDLAEGHCLADDTFVSFLPAASAAIAAADKWEAEQLVRSPADQYRLDQKPMYPEAANMGISPGINSAIQDELDHPPASIMEEGK